MLEHGTENPYEVWAEACQKAKRSVSVSPFEMQGEVAIEMALNLLGVAHQLRGVACPECAGRGQRGYASTSTWRGGIGGSALTDDICDACWGTGRTDRTGADLRMLTQKAERQDRHSEDHDRPTGLVHRKAFDEVQEHLAAAERRVAVLEDGIKRAFEYANHRWSEWGDRAEVVADILADVLELEDSSTRAAKSAQPAPNELLHALAEELAAADVNVAVIEVIEQSMAEGVRYSTTDGTALTRAHEVLMASRAGLLVLAQAHCAGQASGPEEPSKKEAQ